MSPEDRIHVLLPWYMAGTLADEEAAAFREHLARCEPCKEEMDFIRKLQAQLERHGESLLDEHPSSERLIAAIRGELEDEDAQSVKRHLALCAACATESRWIRGEASAGSRPASSRGRFAFRPWPWVAAAAAALALIVLVPLWMKRAPSSGVVLPHFVHPVERAEGGRNLFALREDQVRLRLMLEVDFSPRAYPLTLEIANESGDVVFRQTGIGRDLVQNDIYMYVECERRLFSAGRYSLRVAASSDVEPELVLPFELIEP